MNKKSLLLSLITLCGVETMSQDRIEYFPLGDMNNWIVREIEESMVIGGHKRYLYCVAVGDTIRKNEAYHPRLHNSWWASSNVYAKVAGVSKTSVTVFPERRDKGYCARLETKLEECKVLGMINITVLSTGSLFLGEAKEPIKNAAKPMEKLDMGIPYNRRPKALIVDYKAKVSPQGTITKATVTSTTTFRGIDPPQILAYLQKRWEDKDGNVYAKRIATAYELIERGSTDWVNNHRLEFIYGDATRSKEYRPYMRLQNHSDSYNCTNSHGEMMPVIEVGWGDANDTPTHMIMMFSSGSLGAYVGALGNILWIDNVRLVF